jgi:sugar lactone lactonase YvrE
MPAMTPIKILVSIVALAPLASAPQAQVLTGPESLEFDHRSGITYVASKDADQILARAPGGSLSLFKQLPVGTPSPHGLRIAGDTLYVAFGAAVLGFALADATATPAIPIAGAGFLNGMASDGRDRLWVSDFSTRRIHAIDLSAAPPVVTTLVAHTVFVPNGLEYDATGNRLLVAGWGGSARLAQVPLATGTIADLHTSALSNLDGIARDCAGNLYVSSWGSSALLRFDVPLFTTAPVVVLPGLSQPSDIRFVRHGGAVLVPNYGSDSLASHATDCLYGEGFER